MSFSLDMGHERAIYGTQYEEFFRGLDINVHPYNRDNKAPGYSGDITVYELPPPIQLNPDLFRGYKELWLYFIEAFAKAMDDPKVGTVVIDTMTLLRKTKADAYLQEKQEGGEKRKQLIQIEYGHPDGMIRSLYSYAANNQKNLVATHHLRDSYVTKVGRDGQVESMASGEQEIDGVRDTLRYVDVAVRNLKLKGQLQSQIMKSGPNLALEGNKLPNLTWDMLVNVLESNWHGKPFPRRNVEAT